MDTNTLRVELPKGLYKQLLHKCIDAELTKRQLVIIALTAYLSEKPDKPKRSKKSKK